MNTNEITSLVHLSSLVSTYLAILYVKQEQSFYVHTFVAVCSVCILTYCN
jgi:hypothetical protein